MKRVFLVASFLACAAVAACSGTGGNVGSAPSPNPGGGGGVAPQLNQKVTFTIDIPAPADAAARSFGARRPRDGVYVSPATGSVSIRVVAVNGTSLQQPPTSSTVDVPASCRNKGCKVTLPGVVAAVGTDTFAVTTFTKGGALGDVISSGIVDVAVTAGGNIDTTVGGSGQLTLGGYVAAILLSVGKQLAFGIPGQTTVVVIPQDAGGATIVGNTQFANPIVIALATPAAGLTLAGPGLQLDGTVMLTGPESAKNPVMVAYDGSTSATPPPSGSLLDATSVNSAGATVSAPPVIVMKTPPSPTPPPNLVTPLPIAPSPVASTGSSATSVYVLNAVDNSVTEFSAPAAGQLVETNPRRDFGGKGAGCTPTLQGVPSGVNGIAVDAAANAYVGTTGLQCNASTPSVQRFGPNATLNGPPPGRVNVGNPRFLPATQDVVLQSDAKAGTLDVSDDSTADIVRKFRYPSSVPDPELGYDPANPGVVEDCLISPGFPGTNNPACSGPSQQDYFDASGNSTPNLYPYALGPDGSLYVVAGDAFAGPCPPSLYGCFYNTILRVSPANQKTQTPIVADKAYIEGPATDMRGVASIAIDAVHNRLWVLSLNSAEANPIDDPTLFGTQEYLLAFDLSVFNGASGPQNVRPVAAYGLARLPGAGTGLIAYGNELAAAGGLVYMASPTGPTPCPDANCPKPGQAGFNDGPEGEIDVYDGGITGFHTGVPAGIPSAVLYGYKVKAPIGIAIGPRGSILSVKVKERGAQSSPALTERSREAMARLRSHLPR